MSKQNTEHYVDNKEFYDAIIEYYKDVHKAERNKQETPPLTHYLGECLYKIAERLSYDLKYRNYPFREDMVSDAIENCVRYFHNFDPQKSKNPFAYFTQITKWAFWRKIAKEQKYSYNKHKITDHVNSQMAASTKQETYKLTWGSDAFDHIGTQVIHKEFSDESINQFVKDYEKKKGL